MAGEEKTEQIKEIIKEKIREWYDKVENLKLEDLEPNIFLAQALNLKNAREFIDFYVNQHVQRSLVTSFGFLIEKICAVIGNAEKVKGIKGADIRKNNHYIQVKSGPISCNRDMAEKISQDQREIKENNPNAITCLGLTYGKKEDVFGIISSYYEGDKILVGKEFWEFLSGDPEAYKKVLRAFKEASEDVLNEKGKTIIELRKEKTEELTKEWIKKYGDKIELNALLKFF